MLTLNHLNSDFVYTTLNEEKMYEGWFSSIWIVHQDMYIISMYNLTEVVFLL